MLVLFETAAGYALFKVLDQGKVTKATDLSSLFSSASKAQKMVSLLEFQGFSSTTGALAAATSLVEGKCPKDLKKFLRKSILQKEISDQLLVQDPKLAANIQKKLEIPCISGSMVTEISRCIRGHIHSLIEGLAPSDLDTMSLALSHSMSRYKIKFSPDKVDTMIVQAIALLDDLDKELNTYSMRVREWYGWHFPELTKIITDNLMYCRLVLALGLRKNIDKDLSEVLPSELEEEVKEAAKISMGTEISVEDVSNICELCKQVVDIHIYREQLYDYLKNRMNTIAPNLTTMVGELVGARLIARAGSLLNLAKHPASTIQILGAEKALFRALKTKHDTPKYGLIYHTTLIGQTTPKNRGKISRLVASKTALSCRIDALTEKEAESTESNKKGKEKSNDETNGGPALAALDYRAQVEARIRHVEQLASTSLRANPKKTPTYSPHQSQNRRRETTTYNEDVDSTLKDNDFKKPIKKEFNEEPEDSMITESPVTTPIKKEKEKKEKPKKVKRVKEESTDDEDSEEEEEVKTKKKKKAEKKAQKKEKQKKDKKKRKRDSDDEDEDDDDEDDEVKPKKKKKSRAEDSDESDEEKRPKKKKKTDPSPKKIKKEKN